MSPPLPSSLLRLGLADDTGDFHYVHDLLQQAGVKSATGEGSRVWGYTIIVEASELQPARDLIFQSHRYRTGDLHVFMLEHCGPINRKWEEEDVKRMLDWRGSLRSREDLVALRGYYTREPNQAAQTTPGLRPSVSDLER